MAKKSLLVLHPDIPEGKQRRIARYKEWRGLFTFMLVFAVAVAGVMIVAWHVQPEYWLVVAYLCGLVLLAFICLFTFWIGWPWLSRDLLIQEGRAFWLPEVFRVRYTQQLRKIDQISPEAVDVRNRQLVALFEALLDMRRIHISLMRERSLGREANKKRCTRLEQNIDTRWSEFIDPL